MSKYSKINFVYFMQKWMDSVPGQTFLNYAYSWGAAVVILGTLFKLTHLPGANIMLFLGMGTEVFVFFISAFDRPFDKTTIDMPLANHLDEGEMSAHETVATVPQAQPVIAGPSVVAGPSVIADPSVVAGQPVVINQSVKQPETERPIGTIIIGKGAEILPEIPTTPETTAAPAPAVDAPAPAVDAPAPAVGVPAPAVTPATAEAMETATVAYVERLEQLNETLKKVEELSGRLATDSEEMENLNRTLTGIARVYEMQLKSASQQITTQDSINEQTRIMAEKISELNSIYARMIEAMTTNMPKGA